MYLKGRIAPELLQLWLLAGKAHEDFFVLGERVLHDVCRNFRTRIGLAPVESFEPVTNVLLVEAFLVLADLVLVCRPVTAGVRREHFVDEDGFAIDFTEFELGVGEDDALGGCVVAGLRVDVEGHVTERRCNLFANDVECLFEADVFVVANVGLGARRVERLFELLAELQAFGENVTADLAGLLVVLPARTHDVTAHDAFDRVTVSLLHDHGATAEVVGVLLEHSRIFVHVGGDEVVLHAEVLEPEQRKLVEDFALTRDRGGEHHVKSGKTVASDHQEAVAEVVHVAYFALVEQRNFGNGSIKF